MITAALVRSTGAFPSVADAQAPPLATLMVSMPGWAVAPTGHVYKRALETEVPLHVFAPDTAPPGGWAPAAGRDASSLP
jgi:hypothetical protein